MIYFSIILPILYNKWSHTNVRMLVNKTIKTRNWYYPRHIGPASQILGKDYSHSIGSGGSTKVLIRPHYTSINHHNHAPIVFYNIISSICMIFAWNFMSNAWLHNTIHSMYTIFILLHYAVRTHVQKRQKLVRALSIRDYASGTI